MYTPGETIKVKVKSNNSDCSKAVSGYKLKLQRNILASSKKYEQDYANHRRYISVVKDSVNICDAHEVYVNHIELQIPELEDYNPSYVSIKPCFKRIVDEDSMELI